MAACWDGCMSELGAYKVLGKLVFSMCSDPQVYRKVTLSQYLKAVAGFGHEMVTNTGQSCEEVAEVCCGKGNFSALSGKVAIITGASNGLGLENARVLMKYGCHVIWAVRSPEKAQKCLEEIEAKDGTSTGKATVLKVDLSDLSTVKPFVTEFLKLNLPLHYLVLNAGILGPPQWEASPQGYEKTFATNNLGHFLMTELLFKKLEETASSGTSAEARVVILSSAASSMCAGMDISNLPASKEDYRDFADYCVSKACDSFHTRSLQRRCSGKNILVTCVHPGIIGTGLLRDQPGFSALFFGSYTFAPFRKGIPSGAATTMYCTLSPAIRSQIQDGYFYYYNRKPQYPMGISKPGVADHLMEELEKRQMQLIKPYM
eukprot:TRINITY_DN42222_c0_g1_i1.p1 TRINITY_DN42222_c0_g1~~TRINITY_DN42222_c0_g1_i1.p1  ORF type:complete len:391 (+),score=58.59 TRINITY_DN42222_c0_g1_i1:54-1175(+)